MDSVEKLLATKCGCPDALRRILSPDSGRYIEAMSHQRKDHLPSECIFKQNLTAKVAAFRDEDGMERCPFCPDFVSASETAMDNHVQFDHGGDYWRVWLFMNGRTK